MNLHTSIIWSGSLTVHTMMFLPAFLHSDLNLNNSNTTSVIYRKRKRPTYFCPSAVVNEAKDIENASQSFQKYFLAMSVLWPIYERRQYGNLALAKPMKRGCHNPRRIRGASTVSQLGCAEMISCMRENNLSGSFCTLTSTLKLMCWFSGCKGVKKR